MHTRERDEYNELLRLDLSELQRRRREVSRRGMLLARAYRRRWQMVVEAGREKGDYYPSEVCALQASDKPESVGEGLRWSGNPLFLELPHPISPHTVFEGMWHHWLAVRRDGNVVRCVGYLHVVCAIIRDQLVVVFSSSQFDEETLRQACNQVNLSDLDASWDGGCFIECLYTMKLRVYTNYSSALGSGLPNEMLTLVMDEASRRFVEASHVVEPDLLRALTETL